MKNLKVRKEAIKGILAGAIALATIPGLTAYFNYENTTQQVVSTVKNEDIIIGENGEMCYIFDAGEHILTVSRNDRCYHKINSIDGYEIESVEVDSWSCNNKVTYVNTEPVMVTATKDKNGELIFNSFGTVVDEKENTMKK